MTLKVELVIKEPELFAEINETVVQVIFQLGEFYEEMGISHHDGFDAPALFSVFEYIKSEYQTNGGVKPVLVKIKIHEQLKLLSSENFGKASKKKNKVIEQSFISAFIRVGFAKAQYELGETGHSIQNLMLAWEMLGVVRALNTKDIAVLFTDEVLRANAAKGGEGKARNSGNNEKKKQAYTEFRLGGYHSYDSFSNEHYEKYGVTPKTLSGWLSELSKQDKSQK